MAVSDDALSEECRGGVPEMQERGLFRIVPIDSPMPDRIGVQFFKVESLI